MGKSNTLRPAAKQPRSPAAIGLYLLPVLFGIAALFAGGIAYHSPIVGVGMLAFVLAGYVAATALVASMMETTRQGEPAQVISYTRQLRRV